MHTLILENVPSDIYDCLEQRALLEQRTMRDETLCLISEALGVKHACSLRLPDLILSEEIAAPFDLPRSSVGVQVGVRDGGKRLPDPLVEDAVDERP
jgi:hypothetical protein